MNKRDFIKAGLLAGLATQVPLSVNASDHKRYISKRIGYGQTLT
jgi:hypothetical protein